MNTIMSPVLVERSGTDPRLQGIYARAEHWVSDAVFYREELGFLNKLIIENVTGALDPNSSVHLRFVKGKIAALDKSSQSIEATVRQLLSEMAKDAAGSNKSDIASIEERITEIEIQQVHFLKRFRSLKREVFLLLIGAMKYTNLQTISDDQDDLQLVEKEH